MFVEELKEREIVRACVLENTERESVCVFVCWLIKEREREIKSYNIEKGENIGNHKHHNFTCSLNE